MKRQHILLMLLLAAGTFGIIALGWPQQVETKPTNEAEKTTGDNAKTDAEKDKAADRKDTKEERVKLINADSLFRDKAAGVYYCKGNVVFSHKEIMLYCDEAEYYDKTDTAKAFGHLKIVDPEATITGDLMEANFEDKITVVTGNVRILAQKKNEEDENGGKEEQPGSTTPAAASTTSEEGKEPERLEDYAKKLTTITCDKVDYYYDEDVKKAIATGNVKAVQEDKTAWAEQAIYEQIPDQVTLIGNVRLETDDGDEFQTPKAIISIAEDWIRAENVTGITLRREEKNEGE